MVWAMLLGMVGTAAPAFAASACDEQTPCQIDNGSYLVKPPPGWDGHSPLPLIVFFHGAFNTARSTMQDESITQAAASVGALLVAADGAGKNWNFPGKMTGNRDDFRYVDLMMDDVMHRFPIDKSRVLASGFSVGGSMVWYLACLDAARFTAFAPVAGAFWEPMPDTCPAGPVSLRHVHGTTDITVPMKGRSLRNGLYRQGDVEESLRRLRVRDGCTGEPQMSEMEGNLTCRRWAAQTCSSGREVMVCLHPEDHMIKGQWVADGFRWMEALPAARIAGH
jgi:polyhydroxybutyrate depolymerase